MGFSLHRKDRPLERPVRPARTGHHNNTPASVLDAPAFTPTLVVPQKGYSRQERRHGTYFPPGMDKAAIRRARVEAARAGRNTPFHWPDAGNRLTRKGRKARFNPGRAS